MLRPAEFTVTPPLQPEEREVRGVRRDQPHFPFMNREDFLNRTAWHRIDAQQCAKVHILLNWMIRANLARTARHRLSWFGRASVRATRFPPT